jgi:SAM-dependent methyltransferase
MNGQQRAYIPALRFERLTGLFDLVVRFTMREAMFKRRLVAQAGIAPGQRVLDIGCGTGTLALLVKRLHPEAEVIGFDADATVLAIARRKAVAANLAVTFDQGLSDALPYPNQSFDRVLTSLFFHHLRRDAKVQTLGEIWRVLRPGGELHIADFGRPGNLAMRLANLPVRLLGPHRLRSLLSIIALRQSRLCRLHSVSCTKPDGAGESAMGARGQGLGVGSEESGNGRGGTGALPSPGLQPGASRRGSIAPGSNPEAHAEPSPSGAGDDQLEARHVLLPNPIADP